MSSERDDILKGERLKKQQETEERLKVLEEQNASLVSNNERLLGESKKFKEQARGFETLKAQEDADKKTAQDDKLREQGQYKQLLEQNEKRILDLEKDIESEKKKAREADETLSDAKKLSAFQRRLGGQLKNDDYLAFVKTSNIIVIDGKIDNSSVDTVVKDFLSKHEALVDFGARRMPNGQGGKGGGTGMSRKQWGASGNKAKIDNFEDAFKASQR